MEYLDNEMDDLFRKAGEHYPLKTSDSDWDAVLGRLQPAAGDQNPVDGNEIPKKRNNKNRRFFWLLLLLPLGLFSIQYFFGGNGNRLNSHPAQAEIQALKETTASGAATDHPTVKKEESVSAVKSSADPLNAENKTSGHTAQHIENLRSHSPLKTPAATKPAAPEKYSESTLPDKSVSASATLQAGQPPASGQQEPPGAVANSSPSAIHSKMGQDNGMSASDKIEDPASGQKDSGKQDHQSQADRSPQANSAKDSARLLTTDQKGKKAEKISTQKEKGLYLSLLAGPDFSMVKFQSVKNMGYSIGLLAGYRFNKHISVESGLYWDKKQYYSDGEYFNTSKTGIPGTVKIKDLDGDCSMFEIPVSFRYDFAFGRKGRFFSTVGLNSYIMKKENYGYTTNDYPGWYRKVSYNNSSNNLFSILQLSAGYEYKLGRIGRIRVEPYLNIPLKGVGIGSMPISSAGLHLGITIPFR